MLSFQEFDRINTELCGTEDDRYSGNWPDLDERDKKAFWDEYIKSFIPYADNDTRI